MSNKNSPSNSIKILLEDLFSIYKVLGQVIDMYQDVQHPVIPAAKRICNLKIQPEIDFFNTLTTVEQRRQALQIEVEICIDKLSADILPDLPNNYLQILSPITEGQPRVLKSALKEKLKKVKNNGQVVAEKQEAD